ncbi:MAG: hypothetical protein ACOC2J_05095, partial [bacterium]
MFKQKTLFSKFLIPTLIVLVVGMSTIGGIGYFTQRNYVLNSVNQRASTQIHEIENMIEDRRENVQITEEAIDKYLIMLTKAITEQLKIVPDANMNSKISQLVRTLGISEIHVINEDGVIQASNINEFIGFDFASSAQTRPFLEGLNNKLFTLAQAPQRRGADNELFKYVGVARADKTGIVQIGVQPEGLQELMDKIDIVALAGTVKYGNNGYVYILD